MVFTRLPITVVRQSHTYRVIIQTVIRQSYGSRSNAISTYFTLKNPQMGKNYDTHTYVNIFYENRILLHSTTLSLLSLFGALLSFSLSRFSLSWLGANNRDSIARS